MLDKKDLLAISIPIHPKKCSMRLRSGLCASQSSSSTLPTHPTMSFGPCFVHWGHDGIEKDLPQIIPTKLRAKNCSKCLDMQKQ